jgi:hypothetical protein
MEWRKIKEKTEDYIVGLIFLLISSLCVVVWQAVPSETWTRLGAAISKRAIAAVSALLLIGLSTAIAYIFSLRKSRAPLQSKADDLKAQISKLQERVSELSSDLQKAEIENRRLAHEVEQLTHDALDDTGREILASLSLYRDRTSAELLARSLNFHRERILFYLTELERQGYIMSVNAFTGNPTSYLLTQKARDFLMKNDLI